MVYTNGPRKPREFQVSGDQTARVTPVPIPNTVVKPRRADDTARVTVWERRSSPGLNSKAGPIQSDRPFLFANDNDIYIDRVHTQGSTSTYTDTGSMPMARSEQNQVLVIGALLFGTVLKHHAALPTPRITSASARL